MLVHFPVACWTLAAISDGLALAALDVSWPDGWILLAIGLGTALPAMVAGFLDLGSLPKAGERDGQVHMILMSVAWAAFLVALVTRLENGLPMEKPGLPSIASVFAGMLAMAAGGWYGGRLVYTHGAGRSTKRMDLAKPD